MLRARRGFPLPRLADRGAPAEPPNRDDPASPHEWSRGPALLLQARWSNNDRVGEAGR
jgi:hypothetical protein